MSEVLMKALKRIVDLHLEGAPSNELYEKARKVAIQAITENTHYVGMDFTRFWEKTVLDEETGCWNWTGAYSNGYAKFNYFGKNRFAHRIAFMSAHGEIPVGHEVCHKCDNRKCVNPDHLFAGTRKDNLHDMYAKGRSVHYKGEKVTGSKLKEADIVKIRNLKKDGESLKDIAKKFGVNHATISCICNRRTWRHVA